MIGTFPARIPQERPSLGRPAGPHETIPLWERSVNGSFDGPGKAPGETSATALMTITERNGERVSQPVAYRSAFQAAPLAMALLDAEGRVLATNHAFQSLFGTAPGAPDTPTVADLGEPDAPCPLHTASLGVLRGHRDRGTVTQRLRNATGHTFWARLTVHALRPAPPPDRAAPPPARNPALTSEREAVALLAVEDLSEHHALQERLRHLRMHDPVTRLPNRELFFERLAHALDQTPTGRIGLCYLDLDGFKAVNDTFGHRVGDRLLREVAQRLRKVLPGADDTTPDTEERPHRFGETVEPPGAPLAARLGGDEFALLVPASTGTEQLTHLADAVLTAVQRPVTLAGQRLALSASIGVVEREAAGTTPTGLMQAADTTLYWAKADGRARWTLFDPERNAHRRTRQALSSTVRPALERGEFALEYQPIVGLHDDHLHGVEALVRWHHPRFGTLGPNEFISITEENGTIVPLGRWVLAESCRQARRWQLAHPTTPLYISVNVAVRQVWDSDLVADVATILRETGLPPALLQLELTESAVMGSAGRPLRALEALSEMGVRIAIDDFGTGYSNLAYLSRLPARALKLDGTFVRGFRTAREVNAADETIVTALVQLAHKLGLTVTAECVEGPIQAERLRRIGCDTGQGWHYSRPVPAQRVDELLSDRR